MGDQVKPPWEPKVGDVVKLRSGSPHMTVIAVEPKIVTCWWPNSGDGQYSFDVMRNSITWDDVRLLEFVK